MTFLGWILWWQLTLITCWRLFVCYNDSDFESMIISKFAPFQSFSSVGRKLPLLRVTSSIGWSCGGCSLGWGYCADRLDLDDLQAPTVAAKALGRTLHAENFSELIWKFDPVRIVRILLFDSVTWGWFPLWAALWAALCSTLPPKLPPRNGSERFRTVLNYCGGVYAWCLGTFGPAFGSFLCVLLLS